MEAVSPNSTIEQLRRDNILSVRAANCCINAGLHTVREILNYYNQAGSWQKLRGCGAQSARELTRLLDSAAMLSTIRFTPDEAEVAALIEEAVEQARSVVAAAASTGDKAEVAAKVLALPLASIVARSTNEQMLRQALYDVITQWPLEEYLPASEMLPEVLRAIYAELKKAEGVGAKRVQMVGAAMDYLVNYRGYIDAQHVEEALGSERWQLLLKHYTERVLGSLPTRPANILAGIVAQPANAIPYALGKRLPINNPKIKSYAEIQQALVALRKEIDIVSSLSDFEVRDELTRARYPYLDVKDRRFVYHYTLNYGYEPVAFIIMHLLANCPRREARMAALRIGLDGKEPASFEMLAKQFGFTRERARQITTRKNIYNWLLTNYKPDPRWLGSYWSLINKDVVSSKAASISRLILDEGIDGDSNFVLRLISILSGADVYEANNGISVAVKPHLSSLVSVRTLMRDFERRLSMRRLVPERLKIDDMLSHLSLDDASAEVNVLVKELGQKVYGLRYDADNNALLLVPNTINVPGELVEILRKEGSPLHINQLCDRLNARHSVRPKHYSVNQVRSHLLAEPLVRPLGKTSSYGLAEWGDVYYGTITDYIYELLSRSDKPMPLRDIHAEVVKVKETSLNSVGTIIAVDTKNRFVHFADHSYGITGRDYGDIPTRISPHEPYSFDKRFKNLREYVATHRRMPVHSSADAEGKSLRRWIYNIDCGRIHTTQEQKDELQRYIEQAKAGNYGGVEE